MANKRKPELQWRVDNWTAECWTPKCSKKHPSLGGLGTTNQGGVGIVVVQARLLSVGGTECHLDPGEHSQ